MTKDTVSQRDPLQVEIEQRRRMLYLFDHEGVGLEVFQKFYGWGRNQTVMRMMQAREEQGWRRPTPIEKAINWTPTHLPYVKGVARWLHGKGKLR